VVASAAKKEERDFNKKTMHVARYIITVSESHRN
jgi:hypothetical protein